MKKVLLSATVLTAVILGGCSGMGNKQGNMGLTSKCEEHCNSIGKRVDAQYSEETGKCQCETDRRNV